MKYKYETTTTLIDFDCVLYLCMFIYITRCEETIPVNFFDTRNNFKGGPLSCILNLTGLNCRHRQFDCFKQPSLAVSYTLISMCAVNIFKRC